jgi:hypothetical protein
MSHPLLAPVERRPVRVQRAFRAEPAVSAPAEPTLQPPLRFSSKVEAEFRAWFYTHHVQRAQVSLGLAQLLVFGSVGIDVLGADGALQRWAALIKLGLISPLLLATLWVSRQPQRRRLFPHFMCASIVAVGATFSLVSIGGAGLSVCQPGAGEQAGACLRGADQALYDAKQRGRNRLAIARAEPSPA